MKSNTDINNSVYNWTFFDKNQNKYLEISELIHFYTTKIAAIVIIGNIYFFIGCIISYYFNKYCVYSDYDENPKNNNMKQHLIIFFHLVFEISLLLTLVFLARKFVKSNITPINNLIQGIDLTKIKEINGNVIIATSFMMFNKNNLLKKVEYFVKLFNL